MRASIRSARQSPISTRPNRPGLVDNYVENNVLHQEVNAFDIRLDYTLGLRDSVFGRYSRAGRDFVDPPPGNVFMQEGNRSESVNFNGVIGHTHTFSSSSLNELRVGVNKYDLAQFGADFGIAKNNELGIPNGNIAGHPYTFGIARFNVPGFRRTGSAGFTTRFASEDDPASDAHRAANSTFKFGGDTAHVTTDQPQTRRADSSRSRRTTPAIGRGRTGPHGELPAGVAESSPTRFATLSRCRINFSAYSCRMTSVRARRSTPDSRDLLTPSRGKQCRQLQNQAAEHLGPIEDRDR